MSSSIQLPMKILKMESGDGRTSQESWTSISFICKGADWEIWQRFGAETVWQGTDTASLAKEKISDLGLHLSQSFSLLNFTIRSAISILRKIHKDNSCHQYYDLRGSYIVSHLKDHSYWQSLSANISKAIKTCTFLIRLSFVLLQKRFILEKLPDNKKYLSKYSFGPNPEVLKGI